MRNKLYLLLILVALFGMAGFARGQKNKVIKQTWEYTVVSPDVSNLNRVGSDGWELVAVDGGHAYLKRPR